MSVERLGRCIPRRCFTGGRPLCGPRGQAFFGLGGVRRFSPTVRGSSFKGAKEHVTFARNRACAALREVQGTGIASRLEFWVRCVVTAAMGRNGFVCHVGPSGPARLRETAVKDGD